MSPKAEAFVIGGGIVGLCAAIRLAERHFSVTVVDVPPPMGAASWGNIGHIATEQCVPLASWSTIRSVPRRLSVLGGPVGLPLKAVGSWLPFGLRMMKAASQAEAGTRALTSLLQDALPAWRRLDATWPEASVLQAEGHYVIWESDRSSAAGRKAWAHAPKGESTVRDLTRAELAGLSALVPGSTLRAIRFEGTGKIADLGQLRRNLRARLAGLGGRFWDRKVKHLSAKGRTAQIVFEDGEILSPDLVAVCGGAASARLLAPLGYRVPLIAERGYHVECEASPIDAATLPMVFEDRSVVVNRFRHGLRIAGFVEFAEITTPPHERKWQRLEKHLAELGIAQSGARRRWMGARPTLPDYLPAIGKSAAYSNLLYAFGHQHLGLTLAPITGEKIARLAAGDMADDGISPFRLGRFSSAVGST